MLSLQSHHIVDLYTWVDDVVPQPKRPKRRSATGATGQRGHYYPGLE